MVYVATKRVVDHENRGAICGRAIAARRRTSIDIGFRSGTETWLVDVDGGGFQRFVPQSRGVSRVPLRYLE